MLLNVIVPPSVRSPYNNKLKNLISVLEKAKQIISFATIIPHSGCLLTTNKSSFIILTADSHLDIHP